MSRVEVTKCYKLISILLQYPRDISVVRQAARKLYELVRNAEDMKIAKLKEELGDFTQFLENSHLWAVQEEYVNTFDLFPLCPPYVSHHVYGESYRKGEYMVRLIEIYRRYGFDVPEALKNELPDHISVVTGFLAVLDRDARREFTELVMNGLKKMADAVRNKDTPYKPLILLTYALCLLDGGYDGRYDDRYPDRSEANEAENGGNEGNEGVDGVKKIRNVKDRENIKMLIKEVR